MLDQIITATPAWIHVATLVVTAASAIAAITPTPKDDTMIGAIYKFVDFLALNFGKAKDKPRRKKR